MKKSLIFLTIGLVTGGIVGRLVGVKQTIYSIEKYVKSNECREQIKRRFEKMLDNLSYEDQG